MNAEEHYQVAMRLLEGSALPDRTASEVRAWAATAHVHALLAAYRADHPEPQEELRARIADALAPYVRPRDWAEEVADALMPVIARNAVSGDETAVGLLDANEEMGAEITRLRAERHAVREKAVREFRRRAADLLCEYGHYAAAARIEEIAIAGPEEEQ